MKKVLSLAILSCVLLLSVCITIIAADTNVAKNASYTYDKKTPVASNGGDPDSTKLTDGELPDTNSLWNGNWVVFESKVDNTDSSILIDLGKSYDVSKISFKMLVDSESGASLPANLKVEIGASSSSLKEVATASYDWVDGAEAKDFTKTLDKAESARYVKISITGRDYGWNTYFGFDEIIVNGSEAATDKPDEPKTEAPKTEPSTPKTGDSIVYVAVIMLSSVAAATIVTKREAR